SEPGPTAGGLRSTVPEAQRLRIEAAVIVLLIFIPVVGWVFRNYINLRYSHVLILSYGLCVLSLLIHFLMFIYYSCGAEFPHLLLTCRAFNIGDIGGTTLNAVRAVLQRNNPYTSVIEEWHPADPYPGYKYWPVMIWSYVPFASFLGRAGIRLTNFM